MLPGVLDVWDTAYTEHLPNFEGTTFCNLEDDDWTESWGKYAQALTHGMQELSRKSSYMKLPPHAIARLRFFLHHMTEYHGTMLFPTKSFIQDIVMSFSKSKEAFCNVSPESM
jgi:hypothetical protein